MRIVDAASAKDRVLEVGYWDDKHLHLTMDVDEICICLTAEEATQLVYLLNKYINKITKPGLPL